MRKVYMAITNNKYELPMAIFDSLQTLSIWSNKSISCLKAAIARKSVDKKLNCKYVRVLFEDEVEDGRIENV